MFELGEHVALGSLLPPLVRGTAPSFWLNPEQGCRTLPSVNPLELIDAGEPCAAPSVWSSAPVFECHLLSRIHAAAHGAALGV